MLWQSFAPPAGRCRHGARACMQVAPEPAVLHLKLLLDGRGYKTYSLYDTGLFAVSHSSLVCLIKAHLPAAAFVQTASQCFVAAACCALKYRSHLEIHLPQGSAVCVRDKWTLGGCRRSSLQPSAAM